jgi:branched-chain amino acid transport system permease protein
MSAPDARVAVTAAGMPRAFVALGRHWPWLALLALAVLVPWLFFDWSKGRHTGFVVSLLSQMGMMVVFSLSYNMLMGQSGLLSFGHAVFFGLAGYVTAHAMNAIKVGAFWLPQELLPLIGGGAGLLFGIIFGYMVTKQRATAFAMITLGLGELVTAAAVMFVGFFGGEGGVTTNRMLKTSLFGLSYGPSIQVYYLILGWTAISVAAMLLLTRTPLGRMANACRDNHERAQFVGYDPRMVRFYQFALAGGFAGIAGSLYAITYEIVTYDAANAVMSGNALLMTFIGGVGVFWGPIVGAVLITLLQSWMSLLSNAWLIYVGVLFIVMVIYAPGGIAGLVLAHRPIWQAGRLGALALPYLRIVPPGLAMLIGFVGLVELCTFVTIGAGQGRALVLFQHELDTGSSGPWLVAAALFAGGGGLLLRQSRVFAAAWNAVGEEIKAKEALL